MGERKVVRDSGLVAKKKVNPALEAPRQYQVLMLNDDFTPMDFVVMVLEQYFNKTSEEAMKLMLAVHHQGQVVCGVYTKDVAETKVLQVTTFARQQGYPLRCEISLIT